VTDLEELARLPTSAMSEHELVRGYSRAAIAESVSRPCACGTVIVAVSDADDDIKASATDHVDSPAHLGWRLARDRA
jgi:hypothetical protein